MQNEFRQQALVSCGEAAANHYPGFPYNETLFKNLEDMLWAKSQGRAVKELELVLESPGSHCVWRYHTEAQGEPCVIYLQHNEHLGHFPTMLIEPASFGGSWNLS